MSTRFLAAWIVLIGIQSAVAEERSLVVARRSTGGAIVDAPLAAPAKRQPTLAAHGIILAAATATDAESQLQHKTREVERLQAEIKQLRAGLGTNPQILVRVQMLEVSRTKLRKTGIDLPNAPGKTSNAKSLKAYLSSLEENRIAKLITEPNIIITNGRPASFFVGGEIPIPSRDESKKAVEFQKFGTEIDLLATASDNGQVRMELRIKVSNLDESHAIEINGARVPGLTVRQCDTALSVACGETAIIECPGETQTVTLKSSDGQMKDQEDEIILLVAVTPEFVEPLTPPKAQASVVPAPQELATKSASYLTASAVGQNTIHITDLVTVLVDDIPTSDSDTQAADKDASRVHRIAASVIEVQPNGVLQIEGKSEVCVGDEVWHHSISGNIRPQSLKADRTVRRQDIAEFRYKIRKMPIGNSAAAPTAIETPKVVHTEDTGKR